MLQVCSCSLGSCLFLLHHNVPCYRLHTIAIFLFCYGSLIKGLYFTHTLCAADTVEDRSAEKKKLVITFILATAGFVIGYGPVVVYETVMIFSDGEKTNT